MFFYFDSFIFSWNTARSRSSPRNWTYIRRSENVLDVFWTSYVRSICALCLREEVLFYEYKLFLNISKNLQENTCARVSFLIKLLAWGLQPYLKRIPSQVYSWEFREIFKITVSLNTSGGCFRRLLHRIILCNYFSDISDVFLQSIFKL